MKRKENSILGVLHEHDTGAGGCTKKGRGLFFRILINAPAANACSLSWYSEVQKEESQEAGFEEGYFKYGFRVYCQEKRKKVS